MSLPGEFSGGVDRDPIISPPRFLHIFCRGRPLQSFLQSFNCPTITGRGCPPSYTNNTIFKITSLIKLSQSQGPGIVMDTVYSFNVATTPIYSCRIWLDQLCINVWLLMIKPASSMLSSNMRWCLEGSGAIDTRRCLLVLLCSLQEKKKLDSKKQHH